MTQEFQYFVVFAEMRTGSNFLEANLNLYDGIACHGEAFNPHFVGYPNRTDLLGIDQAARDANPMALVARLRGAPGVLNGFRYFHDHEPRILEALLDDPLCAKIILTRNPADSYVSWKIAQATNQWKLTNINKRKTTRARFEASEFDHHVGALQNFQLRLLNGLQARGQTAFYIGYDDLNNLDVLNGLARWLGVGSQLDALDGKMKKQNPEPLSAKVENFEEMETALARYDRFDLTRTPNFEPRRGPVVPGYVAAAASSLLFLPIRSGPEAQVLSWIAALDGIRTDLLQTDFTQKTLRQWLKHHKRHRKFTVLRHPVARAHRAFCDKILSTGPGSYTRLRKAMIHRHDLPIPEEGPMAGGYDRAAHQRAFKAFLKFLKANLDQQTNIRVDAHWCSQTAAIQGMAEYALPDILLREEQMAAYLPVLAEEVGCIAVPEVPQTEAEDPFPLAEIYDTDIEAATRAAYPRDYIMFGFDDWCPARNI